MLFLGRRRKPGQQTSSVDSGLSPGPGLALWWQAQAGGPRANGRIPLLYRLRDFFFIRHPIAPPFLVSFLLRNSTITTLLCLCDNSTFHRSVQLFARSALVDHPLNSLLLCPSINQLSAAITTPPPSPWLPPPMSPTRPMCVSVPFPADITLANSFPADEVYVA